MGEHCWELVGDGGHGLRGCATCPAFRSGRDCWAVEGTPCSVNPAVCILIACPIYTEHKEAIEYMVAMEDLDAAFAAMDRVVAGWCWESGACPAGLRERCPSYTRGEPCWLQPEPCPCSSRRGSESCLVCPIRVYHSRFVVAPSG